MALRINFNYSAAVTQTEVERNNRLMSKSLLRLSTGLRILNAADDSAGLFIADQLSIVATGLEQGNRNISTAISALQIAENAAGQIFDRLKRIYARVENAANDINDPNARAALQREIDNLIDAINKIGSDTEYNGIKLIDGTFSNKYIHYGARKDQVVNVSIRSLLPKDLGAYMVRGQGVIFSEGLNTSLTWDPAEVAGVTNYTIEAGEYVDVAGVRVYAGTATPTFIDAKTLADNINNDQALRRIGVEAIAKNTNQAEEAFTNFYDLWSGAGTVTAIVLHFWVGAEAASSAAEFSVTIDSNTTSIDKLVSDINTAAANAGQDIRAKIVDSKLFLETGQGETIAVVVEVKGTIDSNNPVDINLGKLFEGLSVITIDSTDIRYYNYIDVGEIDIVGLDTFTISYSGVNFNFDIASGNPAKAYNLNSVSVLDNLSAERSLLVVKKAIERVDTVRSEIGAIMNNLQSIYDSQKVALDNTKEAESVIRNTDFTQEMMTFTTMQIRMQSGIAMLAQANTLPQLVLQLLR